MKTQNEIGYLIYCWEQKGYNFIPVKYNPNKSYLAYLKYYSDDEENKKLIEHVLSLNC